MSNRPQPLPELPAELAAAAAAVGFEPNSMKTMAKKPALLGAVGALTGYLGSAEFSLDMPTALLAAYMSSYGSGCRYCQAHTAHSAERLGVDSVKVENLWQFETSELFDARERAALSFALAAGQQPNAVDEAHYDALADHFSEAQILDLVFMVSMYGFFNRWNDTLGTQLEDKPLAFARKGLAASGWEGGKHVRA